MSILRIDHTVLHIILPLIGTDDGGLVIKAYAVPQLIKGITASAIIDRPGVDISEILGFMYILAFFIRLAESAVLADVDLINFAEAKCQKVIQPRILGDIQRLQIHIALHCQISQLGVLGKIQCFQSFIISADQLNKLRIMGHIDLCQ